MSAERFGHLIKGVFLFAYVAFLAASISHVAYFFHSFEPVPAGEQWLQEWVVPYALAISIDVTSLVLMIGVTYMKQGVGGGKLAGVWVFIAMLTAFSWLANWEYAEQFQTAGLAKAATQSLPFVGVTFQQLNPILASSFAFLNLAYSIAAEFFSSKPRTAEQIAAA